MLWLPVCVALAAAPAGREPAEPGAEANTYAQNLVQVCLGVSHHYVRPVEPAELVAAGVSALFEAARRPLPGGLRPALNHAADPDQMVPLVARWREELSQVEALREPRGLLVSLHGLTRVLDPYSGPISADAFLARVEESPRGVGLELYGPAGGPGGLPRRVPGREVPAPPTPGPWRVSNVAPGSPAQMAGLRPGDEIVRAGGHDARAAEASAALERLQSYAPAEGRGDGFAVSLTVRRAGREAPFDVVVNAAPFQVESVFGVRRRADNSWDYWADPVGKLAHVRVGSISTFTPAQMATALRTLKSEGMRGLLLDLRWNPGGYLNSSTDLARFFLRSGLIARVDYRLADPANREEYRADDPAAEFADVPLVVLVNAETLGGGELLAAALQDNGRAVVAGQRSFGKDSVQRQLPSGVPVPGYSFKLTNGYFRRPSRKSSDGALVSVPWHVEPDAGHSLPVSPDLARRLKTYWQLQTLRPGGSREALPLDDPTADPQRQAALALLRKQIK
jgi:carboxyl-terminal processing protease